MHTPGQATQGHCARSETYRWRMRRAGSIHADFHQSHDLAPHVRTSAYRNMFVRKYLAAYTLNCITDDNIGDCVPLPRVHRHHVLALIRERLVWCG